jgi:hypothetical protein
MPNLNEFFNKPEQPKKNNLEVIVGSKPCFKCDKNSEESFWDSESMVLAWECPDGHLNEVKVG